MREKYKFSPVFCFKNFLVNLNSVHLKYSHPLLLQGQSYLVFLTSAWKNYPVNCTMLHFSAPFNSPAKLHLTHKIHDDFIFKAL